MQRTSPSTMASSWEYDSDKEDEAPTLVEVEPPKYEATSSDACEYVSDKEDETPNLVEVEPPGGEAPNEMALKLCL